MYGHSMSSTFSGTRPFRPLKNNQCHFVLDSVFSGEAVQSCQDGCDTVCSLFLVPVCSLAAAFWTTVALDGKVKIH